MILNLLYIEEILLGTATFVVYVPICNRAVHFCSEHHWVTVYGDRTRINSQKIIITVGAKVSMYRSLRVMGVAPRRGIVSCINKHLRLQNRKAFRKETKSA